VNEISKVINPSGTEQEINEADAERRLKLVYCNGRPNQSVHQNIGTGRYWLGTSRGAAGCVRSSRHGRVYQRSRPGDYFYGAFACLNLNQAAGFASPKEN